MTVLEMKKAVLQIRLPEEEKQEWSSFAEKWGMTLSDLIRSAVRIYIDAESQQSKVEPPASWGVSGDPIVINYTVHHSSTGYIIERTDSPKQTPAGLTGMKKD